MTSILPPTYDRTTRHELSPDITHDESARFNFLTSLNVYLGQTMLPGNFKIFKKRVEPKFLKKTGYNFKNRKQIRKEMKKDPYYQFWAALRRNTMEQRQQAGRHTVLRQLDKLINKANRFNSKKDTLKLNKLTVIPDYIAAVDNHCMPGSYHYEIKDKDILAGANYETGLFITTAGSMSSKGDGGGRSIVNFVEERFPEFSPKRILDLGAGIGINTLPIAQAFPESEVIALDVGAPMLRWGHARAQALGYKNVKFIQADGDLMDFEDETFDWIQTTMFWHETSTASIKSMMKNINRLIAPGGLFLNVEQPNFDSQTTLYDQFMKDWDAWYNNEPFWTKLHEMNIFDLMHNAGFKKDKMFDGGTEADIEQGKFQNWASTLARHKSEDSDNTNSNNNAYKGERWYLFGSWK